MERNLDMDSTENVIALIKEYPIIYDNTLADFLNKEKKGKAWEEIFKRCVPDWALLNEADKLRQGNQIQDRWKNVRASFNRELRVQKKFRTGQGSKRRRKYMFFNQLRFLLPSFRDKTAAMEERKVSQSLPVFDSDYTYDLYDPNADDEIQTCTPPTPRVCAESKNSRNASNTNLQSHSQQLKRPTNTNGANAINFSFKRKKSASPSIEESLSSVTAAVSADTAATTLMRINEAEDVDGDKTFLLSLLPQLRNLQGDEKCECKIELLRLMNAFQKGQRPASSSLSPASSYYPPAHGPEKSYTYTNNTNRAVPVFMYPSCASDDSHHGTPRAASPTSTPHGSCTVRGSTSYPGNHGDGASRYQGMAFSEQEVEEKDLEFVPDSKPVNIIMGNNIN